ncbi:MAG: Holliday junction resolvase RuvX [Candidatus Paracaedibacteraceae bacterium]|nr:Holliday junction resolvase RuvX [Candidatus Paracaedibacteraceae bacterium]
MPIITQQELLPLSLTKSRAMGLDIGNKTIGVALSDQTWMIASAHSLIRRQNLSVDISALVKIIKEYNVSCIISGWPVNMNGTEGPQAQVVKKLIDTLLQHHDIPVFLWDERLSTVAVTRTLLEADMSRKRRSEVVDKMAATFILQGVLDLCRVHKG